MLARALVLFGGLDGANAQQPNVPGGEAIPRAVREAEARRELQRGVDEARVRQEQELLRVHLLKAQAVQGRIAVPGQPARRIWTDQQVETLIFQRDGNAAGARRRLDTLLATQISELDRAYTLTDAQKEKLRLAGRGDIKRFFDKCENVKRKFQLINQGEQNLQEINQDLRLLREASNGLFNESSLLRKSLPNTLTSEQIARSKPVRGVGR
jgi:hypothetical protein